MTESTSNYPRIAYHPDKVWTWPKAEQDAYIARISPLIDAACNDDPGEEHEHTDPAYMARVEKEQEAMTTRPDTDHQARELELYATNIAELYPAYQEIERSTDALMDAGASEEEAQAHAVDKLEPWLQTAAARYRREIGTHHFKRFTAAAVGQAAESIAENITDEYEYRKPYR